ncbi:RNA polymerase II transcriptional coactivator KIWI-like [Tasmannia lanceolata]|uniref:RNA polymerase II transcriptional coactivator KIWI-like n=1 Tax=Tasmannia lanceolata TaxID=3420 RepID=UPI004062E145
MAPTKGKRKEEYESDGDSGGKPKKTYKKDTEDTDTITICELSKNRKVSVRSWQGKVMVDIREFYTKDGREMPGKKGISLSMDQWNIIRDHVAEIDKAVIEAAENA